MSHMDCMRCGLMALPAGKFWDDDGTLRLTLVDKIPDEFVATASATCMSRLTKVHTIVNKFDEFVTNFGV